MAKQIRHSMTFFKVKMKDGTEVGVRISEFDMLYEMPIDSMYELATYPEFKKLKHIKEYRKERGIA